MATRTQIITVLLGLFAGFGGGLLAGFVGHVEPASAVQNQGRLAVLEAGEFHLVDNEGRIRAVLGFRSPSEPELRMLDLNAEKRVSVGIRANGYGGIWVYDKRGDLPSASLHAANNGPASLMLYDKDKGWPIAELGNEMGGAPYDASVLPSLKFWKGGAFTGTLNWHAP